MCLSGKIVQHAGAAPRVAVVAELENDDEDTTLCASIRRTAEERERETGARRYAPLILAMDWVSRPNMLLRGSVCLCVVPWER